MAGFEDTTAAQEKRKARRETEAQAESDELPEAPIRRERALKQLLRTLDHPGIEPREKSYAAKIILDHSPEEDPMAELRKRLGTPAKLRAWALAVAEGAQREIDAEGNGQPGGASRLASPAHSAKAEDGEPR